MKYDIADHRRLYLFCGMTFAGYAARHGEGYMTRESRTTDVSSKSFHTILVQFRNHILEQEVAS